MKVKGTAVLTRKRIIEGRWGAAAWEQLLRDVAQRHPYFDTPLVAGSLVPLADFLALHDEIVKRFYQGNQRAYMQLGEDSASWALTHGPYKSFVAGRDVGAFVQAFPRLWDTYFVDTQSSCRVEQQADVVEMQVFDLPQWHPYLEYFLVGYLKGALELLSSNPVHAVRLGGGSGTQYHYRLRLS